MEPARDTPVGRRRNKVLLVDDSPTVLCVLRTYLMGLGYDFVQAGDGREGLHVALREQPNLVISDLRMPGLDGVSLCKALRRAPSLGCTRLVLISSHWTPELREQAKELGVDACLQKPVSCDDLAQLTRSLLG